MSIYKKDGNNQAEWSETKWEQEQIFTGEGVDYGVAYKFRKSSVKLKKRKNYFIISLLVIILGCTFYFSADYVVTTVANLGGSNVVTAPSISYYAIQEGEYDTIEEATLHSQKVREVGGAGYVYKKDLIYKVLVSVYEKENDATNVLNKIKGVLSDAKVIVLQSPQIVMDYNLEEADSKCLEDVLNLFHNVYSKLYALGVGYDSGEINFAMAQLGMVELQKEFEEKYIPYSSVFGNSRDVRIASLTYKLSVMQDELDKLADPMALQENFSINIKYSQISVCLARAYI